MKHIHHATLVAAACLLAACTATGTSPSDIPPWDPGIADGSESDDGYDPESDDGSDPDDLPPPDDAPPPSDNSDALDAFILGLGHLDIDPIADKHVVPCPAQCATWQDGELSCEELYFSETAHADTFIALSPNSPALWPGAILRGDELERGVLSPIGVPRAPATFSLSLENLSAVPAAEMAMPSLSSFRSARNAILAEGVNGATPAQISYDIQTVTSASQLSVMLGADVEWSGVVDIEAMFDFEDGELAHQYLVDFTQTYYTADLDTPWRPSALLDPSVTVEQLSAQVGEGNPPVYVQSVSYGRRVLFGIESNETLEVIVAAVDAAVAEVLEVGAGTESTAALQGAKITATVLGGDGDAAVQTVLGIEQLLAFITEGGNYSVDSPGVPIAYQVAYLDNVPARLALTSEYPEITCQ